MARGNYSLYRRKAKSSNKFYYYYRTYRSDGARTTGISTGKTSERAARKYCEELFKSGLLVPHPSVLFETYARDWFKWDSCPYIRDRRASGTKKRPGITPDFSRQLRGYLMNHIMPYFGTTPMEKINPVMIRKWRLWMRDGREQGGRWISGLSNKSINNIASALKIILDWALAEEVITRDPFRGISQLLVDDDSRGAFTLDQVKTILERPRWDSYVAWLFTLTAAVTGMREGEVRAIRRECLYPEYIDVTLQYKAGKGLSPLKTKDARKVPICKELYDLLDEQTGNKYFTFDAGEGVPLGVKFAITRFDKIVSSEFPEEKEEKKLVFHSLRHFFNTYLQAENVPINKVDAVIGHSGGKGTMTARYTDWLPEMFPEVYEAQGKLMKILAPDG